MDYETYDSVNVVCPHCGSEQGDSWEFVEENPEEHDCEICEKTFTCWAERDVIYRAKK